MRSSHLLHPRRPVPTGLEQFSYSLPLLDLNYPTAELLAAVAAFRSHRLHSTTGKRVAPAALLAVESVDQLIGQTCDYQQLTEPHCALIAQAKDRVVATVPEWAVAFTLPVEYRALPSDLGQSASCPAWPQRVALSEAAFAPGILEECLIHEHAHQWHYLVGELMPYETAGFARDLDLPSGTRNRWAWEILGALHVVTLLQRWYERIDRPDRVRFFRSYASGCIDILNQHPERLTELGSRALNFLEREQQP